MRAFVSAVIVLAALATPLAAQQTRTLTGTVLSGQTDLPYAGAEVRIVGGDVRVCADARGDFSLPVPAEGETRLRITPVGFEPQEVVVQSGRESLQVALGSHVFILDAVEVVGYAAGFGASVAPGAAVARLDAKDLDVVPTQSIEGAMQGKIAGAYIQSNSGQPGGGYQITLRGVNTILGTPDPLIVVDGVVISSGNGVMTESNVLTRAGNETAINRMSDINPGDVERIEVLRGPAAGAMYGSRASNGVVLITTKHGKAPPPEEVERAQVLQCFIPGTGPTYVR